MKKLYFEAPSHLCHAVKEPNPVITKTLRSIQISLIELDLPSFSSQFYPMLQAYYTLNNLEWQLFTYFSFSNKWLREVLNTLDSLCLLETNPANRNVKWLINFLKWWNSHWLRYYHIKELDNCLRTRGLIVNQNRTEVVKCQVTVKLFVLVLTLYTS